MLRTRTHLTTPPGHAPVTEAGDEDAFELYTPGLALPEEPGVPMRHRRLVVALGTVLAVVLLGWGAFQLVTSGQDFDPSLDPDLVPEQEFDPTISGSEGG